jgi:GxxExxY protein
MFARKSTEGTDSQRSEAAIRRLCDAIRESAFGLHAYLRDGHLEKVYENGLAHRLRRAGYDVAQQKPLSVYDEDGTVLGEYFADLFVEGCLIVEVKASKAIAAEHVAQVLGYLRASNRRDALLINFGASKFEIKKLIL